MRYLKLVRYKNLIIIALTMLSMRYLVMRPMLVGLGMQLQMDGWLFALLVGATVLIAAAGYAINDYFDVLPDALNRPDTQIVGRSVSKRTAIAIHSALNALGVVMGAVVAFGVGRPMLALIFALTTGVLWFYSTTYKRQLLVGNLVVALLSALVPLLPLIFEYPMFQVYWGSLVMYQIKLYPMVYWVSGYAAFAFLLTLAREIIKDMEDFEGDSSFGRNTLPVYFDMRVAKAVVCAVLMLTNALLALAMAGYLRATQPLDVVTLVYGIVLVLMPIFALMVLLLMAREKRHYRTASALCKLIMLLGIGYTLVFCYLVA